MTEPDAGPDASVVANLRMLLPQAAMTVDEYARLSAFPEDAAGRLLPDVAIAWASDAPDIVSVDESGRVSANKLGAARITASAGGLSAETTVMVTRAAISGLRVEPAQSFLSVGERLELGAEATTQTGAAKVPRIVAWESSDLAVATVSPFGMVLPVAPGRAEITASCGEHRSAAVISVVPAKVAQVSLAPLTLTLEPGAEEPLKAAALTARGTPLPDLMIAWQSSDEHVATVDASGNVRAQRIGIAKITASCGGVRAVTTVRVMMRKPSPRS